MDIQRREKYTHLRHLSIQIALLDRRPDQYHASVSRRQDQVWICRGTPLGIPEKVDNQQTERRQYAIDQITHPVIHSGQQPAQDRKSTRLNSSHVANSYAGFCLTKKHYGRGETT